ncbi:MAG: hypothetical protein FJ098_08570 [Deltaproteobacteria bacterium]|nr:hypothetical protein [Deltaproteobacteria bacterium]
MAAGVLVAIFALSLGEFPGHLVPVQLALGLTAGSLEDEVPAARWLSVASLPLLLALFAIPPWLAASDRLLTAGDPASALALNPWNGPAAFAVALAEQEGDAPSGCHHASLALRLQPSPAAATALGLCLARGGDRAGGIRELRRAAWWNPRNAAAHANLAVLLVADGDHDGARSHARRALALRPGDPAIQRACERVLRNTPDP